MYLASAMRIGARALTNSGKLVLMTLNSSSVIDGTSPNMAS